MSNMKERYFDASKRVLVRNLSYGNEIDLQGNDGARETNFHMKDFAPRLALKQRWKQLVNTFNVFVFKSACL